MNEANLTNNFQALDEANQQNQFYKQRIEKFALAIQEKERKIIELQQFEYSFKKASERRHELEQSLEKERQTVQALKEIEANFQQTTIENQQHSKQLERVIQFLRERLEEAQLEAKQLKGEFHASQSTIESLNQLLENAKNQEDALYKRFLNEQRDKEEACEEVAAIHSQFGQLKNSVLAVRSDLQLTLEELRLSKVTLEILTADRQKLEMLLHEKDHRTNVVEQELKVIKYNVGRGIQETRELEARYLEAVNEKVASINKMHHMRQQVENQRFEIKAIREQLKEKHTQHQDLKEESDELRLALEEMHQTTIANLKEEIARLSSQVSMAVCESEITAEKDLLLFQVREELMLLSDEQQFFCEHLKIYQKIEQEADEQVNLAKHHLAKKMKESSVLSGLLEEQKNQLTDLQQALQEVNASMLEQQNSLKFFEAQSAKWEEKYLQMYTNWQQSEAEIKELKLVEEKHSQMQTMLSNLGMILKPSSAMLGAAAPLPPSQNVMPMQIVDTTRLGTAAHEKRQYATAGVIEETERMNSPSEHLKSEQTLFNKPDQAVRFRQNLFE